MIGMMIILMMMRMNEDDYSVRCWTDGMVAYTQGEVTSLIHVHDTIAILWE